MERGASSGLHLQGFGRGRVPRSLEHADEKAAVMLQVLRGADSDDEVEAELLRRILAECSSIYRPGEARNPNSKVYMRIFLTTRS